MLYTTYAVHNLCCTQSMLYTIYAVHNLCCTQSMLCTIYAVHNLYCRQSMLYTIYAVRNLYCTQSMLYTIYAVHYLWNPLNESSLSLLIILSTILINHSKKNFTADYVEQRKKQRVNQRLFFIQIHFQMQNKCSLQNIMDKPLQSGR